MRSRIRLAGCLTLTLLHACGRGDEQAVKGVDTTLPENPATLTGTVSYPSDYVPDDLRVCAEAVQGKTVHCNAKIAENSYTLEVPAGTYRVYAHTAQMPNTKAYYSKFVECGSYVWCESHEPITITVREGETRGGVDPGDWYVPDAGGQPERAVDESTEGYDPEGAEEVSDDVGADDTVEPAAIEGPTRSLVGPLHGLFTSDDYPASAVDNEEQGTVGYRLVIGPSGRVSTCSITASSGSAALDRATCNILRTRARFTPPASGEDRSEGRIHWRLQ